MLILTEADTRRLIDLEKALAAIEDVARWDAAGRVVWCSPPECTLLIPEPKGRYRLKSCALLEVPVVGMRIIGYPQTGGEHDSTRFVLLSDPRTGTPLALIDDHWNYTLRTAASAAAGLKHLVPRRALKVGMVGAGNLAQAMLMLLDHLGVLGEVRVFSRRPESCERFAADARARFGVAARAVDSAEAAVRGADLIVTSTSADKRLIEKTWLGPGATVCTLGRYELDPAIYRDADKVVVDKWEVAQDVPDVKELEKQGALTRSRVYAELGEIITGAKPGRTSDGETIVFRTDGLVAQDVAIAHLVYRAAVEMNLGLKM